MKIAVVGTGYVGLVTGTCFAERGNNVLCIDNNEAKVQQMRQGRVPIYEPDLDDIFQRSTKEGRLSFSTNLQDVADAAVIFLALPTPQGEDGSADLSYVEKVADDLGPLLKTYTVIVDKSTVPVGTAEKVRARIAVHAAPELFDVVSNPEFLREGQAVEDFMNPDRVVIGTDSERAAELMKKLYTPFVRSNPDAQIMIMNPASAELSKYAANAMLASKISFMNGLTALCEVTGADIGQIRKAVGADPRIGLQFLWAGPGYGGSCFPKDTHALLNTAEQYGITLDLVKATIVTNERQKQVIPEKVLAFYKGDVTGKTFALWGLAFKENTDDVRDSPALTIVEELTKRGATIVAFDPQAMDSVRRQVSNDKLRFTETEYDALDGADALIIATNWSEFSAPDFNRVKALLAAPVLFDGRNIYDPAAMTSEGFYYESIGRKTAEAEGETHE